MGRRQCNRARPRDKISTQRCGGTDQATGIRDAVIRWGPAREHFDDAQHLHARRRRVAPQGHRGGRAGTVRRSGSQWTTNGASAGVRDTRKCECQLTLPFLRQG